MYHFCLILQIRVVDADGEGAVAEPSRLVSDTGHRGHRGTARTGPRLARRPVREQLTAVGG